MKKKNHLIDNWDIISGLHPTDIELLAIENLNNYTSRSNCCHAVSSSTLLCKLCGKHINNIQASNESYYMESN